MGAVLDDVALLEHDDAVGVAHGGEAVGDEDGGDRPVVAERPGQHRLEELELGPRVEVGGGLIEHEDRRALLDGVETTGQRDALPLPAGEVDAAAGRAVQGRLPDDREAVDESSTPATRAACSTGAAGTVAARRGPVVGRSSTLSWTGSW